MVACNALTWLGTQTPLPSTRPIVVPTLQSGMAFNQFAASYPTRVVQETGDDVKFVKWLADFTTEATARLL